MRSDADEEENICGCVLDSLGFPDAIKVSAKVLRREDTHSNTSFDGGVVS
jgi:hypothetical protein